ncbi:hypothetical protein CAPTEDRAFT_92183 [Capitella teleta]|uniref:Uncharacterized protein n=1 Tax=Capitella teleta TaxID=283909 RepID=R7UQX3_CAPTE|nr:hypothetical protein CAPTEDRAFT_92183 [Capitella teleta]|eukprot:ELU05826.1 hypothetical protein CAPTEDRAFT_92183 [Capitella teleta]
MSCCCCRNKCLNEKRRREQENIYMEELAELISASITDMNNFSNVKPDKCAILQETVNQIRRIQKPEDNGGNSSDAAAVQQSQVSSSKPGLLCNDVMGPLLLEALDGFLFMVNSQGSVDFVSENVSQYLKYSQDDLLSKSIYNIIHVGDHAQFSNSLLMSMGGVMPWSTAGEPNTPKSRTFNCRMLIKPAGEETDEVEVKQTQLSQYENMQISAFLQPVPRDKEADGAGTDAENQSCLVCIARRIGFAERTNAMLGIEQFTTKQDLNGKILDCDTNRGGINNVQTYKYMYPDFVNQNIQEFCHANDMQQLSKHHKEVLKNGSNTSGVYRFKLQENRYVFVQTKSKLFSNPNTNKPEFIMSTHSIVRECDADTELKGSASTSLMKSIIGQSGGKK